MNSTQFKPSYVPFERVPVPRPVDRIPFIQGCCRGKVVLDLGAMDETAYVAKRGQGTWLHEEIAAVAAHVTGIDSSALIPPEGMRTGTNAIIHKGDIMELGAWLESNDVSPEVVVAGELIEHLENPLLFLTRIKSAARLQGRTLILTTPNATAMHNCLVGLLCRESTHHDHLCILSFKTLYTLCSRAGFADWEIIPYFGRFTELKSRSSGLQRRLISAGEKAVNGLEWLFPLMSFGYVVKVRI